MNPLNPPLSKGDEENKGELLYFFALNEGLILEMLRRHYQ